MVFQNNVYIELKILNLCLSGLTQNIYFLKKIVLLKNPDPYAVQEQVSVVTLVRPESTFVIALHAGQS